MDKKAKALINTLYFSLVLLIGYFGIKYAFVWLLPFVFGFLFAAAVKGISVRLFKNTNINSRVGSITVVLLLYAVLLVVFTVFGTRLVEEAQEHLANLPNVYEKTIIPAFDTLSRWSASTISEFVPNIGVDPAQIVDIFKENTGNMLLSISGKAVDFFAVLLKRIPSIFMFLFFYHI